MANLESCVANGRVTISESLTERQRPVRHHRGTWLSVQRHQMSFHFLSRCHQVARSTGSEAQWTKNSGMLPGGGNWGMFLPKKRWKKSSKFLENCIAKKWEVWARRWVWNAPEISNLHQQKILCPFLGPASKSQFPLWHGWIKDKGDPSRRRPEP